jgi:phage RecT family recombinase
MNQPYRQNRNQNQNQLSKADQVKPLLLAAQKQITSLLQDDIKAKKFMAAALVVAGNKNLKKCDSHSIVQALIGVAVADLSVDPNIGHAYLVPYGDNVQLQIGYKGFIQLLFRAGWMVKCFPVYNCDKFSITFDGWKNTVVMEPDIDNRDEGDRDWVLDNLRGIWTIARHSATQEESSMFVPKSVIEKLRLNSPNQRVNQFTEDREKERLAQGLPIGVWENWYAEMAMAKAVKRLSKQLPIGDSRASLVIAMDDKLEMGKKVDFEKSLNDGVIIELNAESVGENQASGLANVLDMINTAKSSAELDNTKAFIKNLPTAEQKEARSAFLAKSREFETPEKPAASKPEKQKPQSGKPAETSWEDKIRQCKSGEELNELMAEMPGEALIDLDPVIEDKYVEFDALRLNGR